MQSCEYSLFFHGRAVKGAGDGELFRWLLCWAEPGFPRGNAAILREPWRSLPGLSRRVGLAPMGLPAPSLSRATRLPPTAPQEEPSSLGATREQSLPIPRSWCGQMPLERMTQANRLSSVVVPWQKLQMPGRAVGGWRSWQVTWWPSAMGHPKGISDFNPQWPYQAECFCNEKWLGWNDLLGKIKFHLKAMAVIQMSVK